VVENLRKLLVWCGDKSQHATVYCDKLFYGVKVCITARVSRLAIFFALRDI
jgi:hypothetical protein